MFFFIVLVFILFLFMDLDLQMEMGEIVHETTPPFRNLIFV